MSFLVFKADEQARPAPGRKRRRRTVLSCTACRQLKVSCDRRTPCSRCVWRQKADECVYHDCSQKPPPAFRGSSTTEASSISSCLEHGYSGPETQPSPEDDEQACPSSDGGDCAKREPLWYTPKSALRGATHWDGMLHQVSVATVRSGAGEQALVDALDQFQDILPGNDESRRLLDAHVALDPESLRINEHVSPLENFPFTCLKGCSSILSKTDMIARLPDRRVCDLFVERYLRTIEGTHRLFQIPSFKSEINRFWQNPSTSTYAWLAQFFMVLALGHEATAEEEPPPTRDGLNTALHRQFLESAETCISKTSIMFRSDTTLIRCLCLAVIVKLTGVYQCSVIDSCGVLTDMAVRSCMELGLQKHDGQLGKLEQQVRARLWTTAVFLKVQQAANSGTPLLLRACDFDDSVLRNFDDDELDQPATPHPASQYTDSTCQMILARALPTAIDIISAANSSSHSEIACRLAQHETDIRHLLRQVQTIYNGPAPRDRHGWRSLQRPMLEIYLRRILLTIHHISPPLPATTHPQQHFLGSALAILVHQRQILEAIECPAMRMFAGLHKQDFFIAAVGACATLRDSQGGSGGWGLGESTRETIRDALFWCKELWARDVYRSTCNYWAYLILERLLNRL